MNFRMSLLHIRVRRGKAAFIIKHDNPGRSGCLALRGIWLWKTTITRLINGLTPEYYEGKLDGTVTVNGNDTQKTPLYELSKTVGSVFQNPRSQFLMLIQPERLHLAVKILVCQRKKYTDVLGRLRAN